MQNLETNLGTIMDLEFQKFASISRNTNKYPTTMEVAVHFFKAGMEYQKELKEDGHVNSI